MQPLPYDPFLAGSTGLGAAPVQGPFGMAGVGPQPFRMGTGGRVELGFLPESDVEDAPPGVAFGEMEIFELDTEVRHTKLLDSGNVLSAAQQFNYRSWEGPQGPIGLPGDVYRFGWDVEYATPAGRYGPWSFLLGFNPSINSSFEQGLTSDAWNWDGKGVAFYRINPHWMVAGGLFYWDRVDDRVLPYAGVIWTPSPRLEARIMFPESRISYLLDDLGWARKWLYLRSEYHVEAYEVEVGPGGGRYLDKAQLLDWRILVGERFDAGTYSFFGEAGVVFGREVSFKGATPGFDLDTGFIARMGVKF